MNTNKEASALQDPSITGHANAVCSNQAGMAEAASQLQVVTKIRASRAECDCPHCGAESYGWLADPRGRETTCDECNKPFSIAADATVSIT